MRLSMRGTVLISLALSLSLLSACTPRAMKPEVVEVERFHYLPIPAELLVLCEADIGRLVSNSDLLAAYTESRRALESCNAQLKALRELKPPEEK